ncbi:MAG: hypothetical protein V1896_02700, partial [Candidatus Zambryskibacteria bacterium]
MHILRNKYTILVITLLTVGALFSYSHISFNMARAKNISALKTQLEASPEMSAKYEQDGTSLVMT